ncbi:MAG TPA: ABC transporter permease [Pseudoduganella sp.]|jgi:ribose transport system permease protein
MPPTPTTDTGGALPSARLKPPAHSASRLARFKGAGPIIALVLLCIAGALLNPGFATFDNLMNVLTRTAFIGIIAVGMTFVIASGGIDLSVGSMAALIAGVMIVAMNALALGATPPSPFAIVVLGIALALAFGAVAGVTHGFLVTHGRIEPFIVTLGTLGIFRAVLTWLSDGGALTLDFNLSETYGPVYYQSVLGVPVPVWIFALVALAGVVILNRTPFGQHVQAIGSNEQVARYATIRVDRVKTLTYLLLGVCVAIATILYVPRLGSATPTTGILWELEAIAAVVVGGTSLKGGSGRIMGTVIGAILLSVIGNILNLTSIISVYLNAAVQGVVIITVAYLQRGRR